MKGTKMTLASDIMGKLQTAMNEVDKTLGPIEPGSSVRPFMPITNQEEPVPYNEDKSLPPAPDLAPNSLADWMKLLHSRHDHMAAKMDVIEARLTSERESLVTHVTEQQNAILERLEQIAKFLGL